MRTLFAIFNSFTRRERLAFVFAGCALLLATTTWLFFILKDKTEVVAVRGGDYIEGVVGQPAFINPVVATTDADRILVHLLFANVPELSEKISSENNGRVVRVRLKEGLTWSDGRKITADDIIFTVQKIQDPESRSPLFASFQGVVANRISELEIQFNLISPYAFFEEHLKQLHPLPKHIYGETPPANWKLSSYNLSPVSSGPFVYADFEKDSAGFIGTYHMLANKSFPGGEPFIEKFDVKFFSKGEDLLRSFNMGLIDSFGTYDPEIKQNIRRSHNVSHYSLPSYYAVFLNQEKNPILKDAVLRKALHDSLRIEDIVNHALRGEADVIEKPLDVVLGKTGADKRPSVAEIAETLEQVGWKAGVEGPRVKSEKNSSSTLQIKLAVPKIQFLEKTAYEIKAAWSAIGADVEIEIIPPEEILETTIKTRNYDAVLFGNILNPPQDLYAFWHTSERSSPGLNLSMYSNSKADSLIESIRREQNPEKRTASMSQLNDLIASEYPAIFLYSPRYFTISTKDLKGTGQGLVSENMDRFLNASSWYLKTVRQLKK